MALSIITIIIYLNKHVVYEFLNKIYEKVYQKPDPPPQNWFLRYMENVYFYFQTALNNLFELEIEE